MNNDLSKLKVGAWVWTIQYGWQQVTRIDRIDEYPFRIENGETYTMDGKSTRNHKYPSAFITPPAEFNAEPKPVQKIKKWRWVYLTEGGRNLVTEHAAEPPDVSVQAVKLPWTQIEEEVEDGQS